MEVFLSCKCFLNWTLLCVIAAHQVSTAAIEPKDTYQSLTDSQGFYNKDDHVFVLNAANFKSNIYGSKSSWLVEFYNSWCGFCRRFAPTWKELAQDILAWKDIVVVAAIDCADDDNNPICREYEVMHYPMLKFFSVNARLGSFGIEIDKGKDMEKLRQNVIDQLEKEQQEGRGLTWPNITPYRGMETSQLWKSVRQSVQYSFLIFETADSFLGTEVILDMHRVNKIHIRSVTSDNEPLCILHKIIKFPTLLVLSRNNTSKIINVRTPTREGFRHAIKEYMLSQGISIELQKTPERSMESPGLQTLDVHKKLDEVDIKHPIKVYGDVLFQLDLETVLRYSLNHEITLTKLIEGEKMQALKSYVNVLAKYFPLRRSGVVFLDVIRDILVEKESLLGKEFIQIIRSTEEEMFPVYSGPQEWIACKGSTNNYRGYPCGLWIMFHMLSVNSAIQNKGNAQHDPTEVLRAMHGYIKNFFGCADCSEHFQEMAARNKIFDVKTANESILWLWKSHNEVNNRLAGDETEDPYHKKIQYPSQEYCSSCRHANGSWNENEVLSYLNKKYSYSGINYYGSDGKSDELPKEKIEIRQERLAQEKYVPQRKLGWDFTIFDISICVVLYVVSAAILVLVCIKFAVKRTYRKKVYVYNHLGKV
ncbi:sulfhydryl oxidase 2 [Cephus cinctus]|uniref:Sulfhydryl oxidase n=1 Tax=Cephus cinctus TaxID=211228 RepID=A0AAJ7W4C8_CEPCN|nr:sulfhydryl oxidase 2 [Cephus cinctus]XP_024943492.1 sulfhydryl oxidase 2 [Cephus cinctus]